MKAGPTDARQTPSGRGLLEIEVHGVAAVAGRFRRHTLHAPAAEMQKGHSLKRNPLIYIKNLVREGGFEPPTYRLGGGRSIQLSYRRIRPTMLNEALRLVMPLASNATVRWDRCTPADAAMQNHSQFQDRQLATRAARRHTRASGNFGEIPCTGLQWKGTAADQRVGG